MKLNEFINLTDKTTNVETPEEIADKIKSTCGAFLKAYRNSGKVLYRGIGSAMGTTGTLYHGKVRADRKPAATPMKNFDLINQAFEILNLPTRKETINCTTDKMAAGEWGPVFVVFMKDPPCGVGFTHGDYDDIFIASERVLHSKGSADDLAKLINKLRPMEISDSISLSKVLSKAKAEVMLCGSTYVGLRVNSPDFTTVMDLLGL